MYINIKKKYYHYYEYNYYTLYLTPIHTYIVDKLIDTKIFKKDIDTNICEKRRV